MDLDADSTIRPIPVVVNSCKPDSDDAVSESGTNDDVPSDQVTATIWRNAKGGFKEFRPECFGHCSRNLTDYSCPEAYELDNLSDDEEWMRTDVGLPSVNTFLEKWTKGLNDESVFGKFYYNYEARPKIAWALSAFDPITNNECPFDSCRYVYKDEVGPFSSRIRYVRHVVEWHMHHHPLYVCHADTGKASKICQGLRTTRRGRLIEHLKKAHGQPLPTARKTVMELHSALVGT